MWEAGQVSNILLDPVSIKHRGNLYMELDVSTVVILAGLGLTTEPRSGGASKMLTVF